MIWVLLACKSPAPSDSSPPGDSVTEEVDRDGDGDPDAVDCAPDDPEAGPSVAETCDGKDNNCNGATDEGVTTVYFPDADIDGYGDSTVPVLACTQPAGHTTQAGDCDDASAAVNPARPELCDGIDNNCDGSIDEGLERSTVYTDGDGDGWGDTSTGRESCKPASDETDLAGDCDDGDGDVFPGATEACDGADGNCDGVIDDDAPCPCDIEHKDGHAYLFCTYGSDWYGAQKGCAIYGYTLATVDDKAEDTWLNSTASTYATGYWWVGGNDQAKEGSWTWDDGTGWSYTHWCSGEPNNAHGLECVSTSTEEDCAVFGWSSGGCWNDYPCNCSASEGEPYRFVCEAG